MKNGTYSPVIQIYIFRSWNPHRIVLEKSYHRPAVLMGKHIAGNPLAIRHQTPHCLYPSLSIYVHSLLFLICSHDTLGWPARLPVAHPSQTDTTPIDSSTDQ